MTTKVGHLLAKVLGIDLASNTDPYLRDGSDTAGHYVETEPTAGEWLRELVPSRRQIGRYFYDLFPFLHWIMSYNLQWFIGDLIAGEMSPNSCGSE